jgi:AraC-like DNA-binding protein
MYPTIHQFFFSANLAFILTNLYGWILKWFYRPKAYNEEFTRLFPAQRSVGWLYLLQVLEFPYLLHIGKADALLYVNAFSLLVFSLQMLIMCDGYFFPHIIRKKRGYFNFVPAIIVLLPLFLQAIGVISLPLWHRTATFIIVGVLFIWYFSLNINMALRIGHAVRQVNEETYADSDDFPTRFGENIQWLPTSICVLMAVNFFFDDPMMKAFRDLFFTVVNIWFCIYTLNPWREPFAISRQAGDFKDEITEDSDESISPTDKVVFRLSDDRYVELSQNLEKLLADGRIFTEQHITADSLMQCLGINSNYLTEVIQRNGYGSFYDMICQHRVRYAISLIHKHPERKMADIAEACGFSSPSSMNKAFASQGKQPPSKYRKM